MKIVIEDANGKRFHSKGKPDIWINTDGVPVLEFCRWKEEYTQEEYDKLPHQDFKIIEQ